jgi:predicted methyltransferase
MKSVTLLAAFSYVLLWPSGVVGQSKPMTMEEMHRLHQDPNAYVAMLDDPARDAYQKPHDVVMALGLTEGERVADIGSGSGYFALRFASHVVMRRMLDPGGQVVVVDFQAKPTPVGPPPEMRVRRDDVVNEFRAAGYRLVREPTFLPYQYFLAFELGA